MSDELSSPPRFVDGRGNLLVDPHGLGGVELRYVLCDHLASLGGSTCTVAELVRALERYGFRLGGRPSKVVSDALRWEEGRGRVVRVGRGRYRTGSIPGSTRRRIRAVARRRIDLATRWPRGELASREGDRFT